MKIRGFLLLGEIEYGAGRLPFAWPDPLSPVYLALGPEGLMPMDDSSGHPLLAPGWVVKARAGRGGRARAPTLSAFCSLSSYQAAFPTPAPPALPLQAFPTPTLTVTGPRTLPCPFWLFLTAVQASVNSPFSKLSANHPI